MRLVHDGDTGEDLDPDTTYQLRPETRELRMKGVAPEMSESPGTALTKETHADCPAPDTPAAR